MIGCHASCIGNSTGWDCEGGNSTDRSECVPICGDSWWVGDEYCDDGDLDGTSKCNDDCSGSVDGWSCADGNFTDPSVCLPICGDGRVLGEEICDDGPPDHSAIMRIGCNSTCNGENLGFDCDMIANSSIPTNCEPICGDSRVV